MYILNYQLTGTVVLSTNLINHVLSFNFKLHNQYFFFSFFLKNMTCPYLFVYILCPYLFVYILCFSNCSFMLGFYFFFRNILQMII